MGSAEAGPGTDRRTAFLWIVLLCVAALWTFRSVLGFAFISIDDNTILTLNEHMGPPGWRNLRWMFTDVDYVRRYIPLGWLGFSVVFAGWGLSPVAYHAANLFLHIANTVLLFWVLLSTLRRWGAAGSSWSIACAACAAGLWSLHPFRAESVGWISGMLYGQAGFLALLSILAYLRAGAHAQGTPRRRIWLAATALAFLASLLTYPIAIGLVGVFLIIDVAERRPWRMFRERGLLILPAVVVTLATVAIRLRENRMWPASPSLSDFSIADRIMQAFYVFAYYLWKTVVPVRLTPTPTALFEFKPFSLPFLASAGAVVGLTLFLGLRPALRRGALLLWLGYLVLLLPTAGLTEHPHYPNDRYSYLPGMVMAAALGLALSRISRTGMRIFALAAAFCIACASSWATRTQLGIWRNSDAVFARIIEETSIPVIRLQNFVRWAHDNANRGKYAEARDILARGMGEAPGWELPVEAWENSGLAGHSAVGRLGRDFPIGTPGYAEANLKIALAAAKDERTAEAQAHFSRALEIYPDYRDAEYNFAMFLALHGRPKEALHLYLILAAGPGRNGFAGQERLLSATARAFWHQGAGAVARSILKLAFSLPATGSDSALARALNEQAVEYGLRAPAPH